MDVLIRGCSDHLLKVLRRHADCEVRVLPPHGDLIDRDALGEFPYLMSDCDGYEADEWVADAPVIIPADKEDSA